MDIHRRAGRPSLRDFGGPLVSLGHRRVLARHLFGDAVVRCHELGDRDELEALLAEFVDDLGQRLDVLAAVSPPSCMRMMSPLETPVVQFATIASAPGSSQSRLSMFQMTDALIVPPELRQQYSFQLP